MSTPRTFNDTVGALRFGTLHDELTEAIKELTNKCSTTGRVGSITLTLHLKPGKGGQVEVFDDVKLKLPKEERGSSIMFATPEGNLTREDPRQMKLEGIRAVETTTEVRTLNTANA